MKRILSIMALAMALLLAASCHQEDPTIDLSSNDIAVLAEGGSETISFTCNYKWTAQASDAWISVSPTSGDKGGGTVTIKIAENTGTSARIGSVTIDCSGVTRAIRISQAQPFNQKLSLVVTGSKVAAPKIIGNGLTGEIDWGDGKVEQYFANITHDYGSEGNHTITIKFAGGTSFEIGSAAGMKELDLTGF